MNFVGNLSIFATVKS